MKSLARGSTEARNKFALCAVGTPENLGQSLHSSTDDPSHKATTMLPPTAPEHLLLLGHLFRLLVPLPLRGDFSSSLQPCRACPQHPLVTLAPCAVNLLPVAPEGPPVHPYSLCLHHFLGGSRPLYYLCLYYCPLLSPSQGHPFPPHVSPTTAKTLFGFLPDF